MPPDTQITELKIEIDCGIFAILESFLQDGEITDPKVKSFIMKVWDFRKDAEKGAKEINQLVKTLNSISPANKPIRTIRRSIPAEYNYCINKIKSFWDEIINLTMDDRMRARIEDVLEAVEKGYKSFWNKFDEKINPPQDVPLQVHKNQKELYEDNQAKEEFGKTLEVIKNYYGKSGYTNRCCFISYAWPVTKGANVIGESLKEQSEYQEKWLQDFLVGLREDLRSAGILAILDIKDNDCGRSIVKFTSEISESDYVLLIGTKSLLKKHQKGLGIVCSELNQIKVKRTVDEKLGFMSRVFPILLSGSMEKSFPSEYKNYLTIKNWQENTYVKNLYDLIRNLYGAGPDNKDYQNLWINFRGKFEKYFITPTLPASISIASSSSTSAIPQKPEKENIVEEDNDSIGKLLKSYYEQNYKDMITLFPEEKIIPIKDSYVNLAIVKKEEQQGKEKLKKLSGEEVVGENGKGKSRYKRERQREDLLQTYETIHAAEKVPIKLEELFKRQDGEEPKKMLILGRAGIGKTTICQYIVDRWRRDDGDGKLWRDKFKAIFFIKLRDLVADGFDKEKDPLTREDCLSCLSEIILRHCIESVSIEANQIKEYLKSKSTQILFILDGYDEVYEVAKNRKTILAQILQYIFSFEYVLLTSRPCYYQEIAGKGVNQLFKRQLENIGFTNDNIKKYIEKFFTGYLQDVKAPGLKKGQTSSSTSPSDMQWRSCLTFLQTNPSIWGIAHIPINLGLICTIWRKNQEEMEKGLTMTMLYQKIVNYLLETRYLLHPMVKSVIKYPETLSEQDIEELSQPVTEFLERIAFEGMSKYTLLIAKEELEKVIKEFKNKKENLLGAVLTAGFLKANTEGSNEAKKDYYFLHLTFQEFFAARYLVNKVSKGSEIEKKEAWDFIETNKAEQRYEVVWWFVSGLLKDNDVLWKWFMDILFNQRNLVKKFCLCVRCLEESKRADKEIAKPYLEWIKGYSNAYCINSLLLKNRGPVEGALILSPQVVKAAAIDVKLCGVLTNELVRNREVAAEALGKIGQSDDKALQVLRYALQDKNEYVRRASAEALGKIGQSDDKALQVLRNALQYKEGYVRITAALALGKIGQSDGKTWQVLRDALQDEDGHVRIAAAEVLGNLGHSDEKTLQVLRAALQDKDWSVRHAAAEALGNLAQSDDKALQVLRATLQDKKVYVRIEVAEALGNIGQSDEKTLQVLRAALQDKEGYVRQAAAEALGKIGQSDGKTWQVLRDALQDKEVYVKTAAARALGNLGQSDEKTLQILRDALQDKNEYVRRAAAEALGKIGQSDDKTLQVLRVALQDKEVYVRQAVAEALGKIGQSYDKALQVLRDALKDEDEDVKQTAAKALGKIGQSDDKTLQVLCAALQDGNNYVKRAAAEALVKIGQSDDKALQALCNALQDKNEHVRYAATEALGKIGQSDDKTLQVLRAALQDENLFVRLAAAEALGNLGQNDQATSSSVVPVNNFEASTTADSRIAQATSSSGLLASSVSTLLSQVSSTMAAITSNSTTTAKTSSSGVTEASTATSSRSSPPNPEKETGNSELCIIS